MDDLTEPLIAVIGDPIAGNPSQLAIEFALKSLGLEYHVNSFQVAPDNIVPALDGLQVLGYRGVLVDDSLAFLAGAWSEGQSAEDYNGAPVNCLFRKLEDEERLFAVDIHGQWLSAKTKEHFQKLGTKIEKCLWLGNRNKKFPVDLVDVDRVELSTRAPSIDSVADANLIVLSPGPKGEVPLDINEWPEDDGSTLIIDFTDGNEAICNAAEKGYRVISSLDRQIGTIAESFQLWTSVQPSTTIIRDAIEEYLSV